MGGGSSGFKVLKNSSALSYPQAVQPFRVQVLRGGCAHHTVSRIISFCCFEEKEDLYVVLQMSLG